jgi:hypothetical protein
VLVWRHEVERVQLQQLQPWFPVGVAALQDAEVRRRVKALGQGVHEQVQQARRARAAPGNLRGRGRSLGQGARCACGVGRGRQTRPTATGHSTTTSPASSAPTSQNDASIDVDKPRLAGTAIVTHPHLNNIARQRLPAHEGVTPGYPALSVSRAAQLDAAGESGAGVGRRPLSRRYCPFVSPTHAAASMTLAAIPNARATASGNAALDLSSVPAPLYGSRIRYEDEKNSSAILMRILQPRR